MCVVVNLLCVGTFPKLFALLYRADAVLFARMETNFHTSDLSSPVLSVGHIQERVCPTCPFLLLINQVVVAQFCMFFMA